MKTFLESRPLRCARGGSVSSLSSPSSLPRTARLFTSNAAAVNLKADPGKFSSWLKIVVAINCLIWISVVDTTTVTITSYQEYHTES